MKRIIEQPSIVLAPGGGPTLTFMGMNLAYKVSSDETGGAWALIEHTLPPHFAGADLHWHKVTRTGFFVLDGLVTFRVGEKIFVMEPGGFVSVPPQTVHTFGNEQDVSARLLEILLPGGLENYFKELVSLTRTEADMQLGESPLLRDLQKQYDIFTSEATNERTTE